MIRYFVSLLTAATLLTPSSLWADRPLRDPVKQGEMPQYLLFNKTPQAGWSQERPERFTPESVLEIVEVIGERGNEHLKVGVHFPFSVLEHEANLLQRSMAALLKAAETAEVPVMVVLDGQNWWQNRPDLWNWWDPSKPGYDPANRHNVEWTGWGPEHAIKISWRNWGRQIRIAPAPNIFSPRVLADTQERMNACLETIKVWYEQLPPDKRYLFAGLKFGWETSFNVNAFYYEDGNEIFERNPGDPSGDPTDHSTKYGWTFGTPSLGYAAATSAGLKHEGPITRLDHEIMVHRYLTLLCGWARQQGIPRHLIFTHMGGNYHPWEEHLSFAPAINRHSIPGWSFYAVDPYTAGDMGQVLEQAGRRQWGAVEWLWVAKDSAGWQDHFRRTLTYEHCRVLSVYNWEPFRNKPEAVEAVRALLEEAREIGGFYGKGAAGLPKEAQQ